MRAGNYNLGDYVEVTVKVPFMEGMVGKKFYGYVEKRYPSNNVIAITIIKSEVPVIQAGSMKRVDCDSWEYDVKPYNEFAKETYEDIMDFALDLKDLDYAADIYERMSS